MTYQRKSERLWRLKTWGYKRCSKCGRNTKYENILDLYLLKDAEATWNCRYCQHSETIQLDELPLN
ncbi:MAG: hypothetical protein AAFQ80_11125 [Cyanobacteria bacterium J06621_8]